MSNLPAPATSYREAIVRAAADDSFNVEKLERLIALQEAGELRAADHAFNDALANAQAELKPVSTDASNPQTRSKYATYAQLDREVRPVYTRHGFSVSFTTEAAAEPNTIMVVGMLTHGPISRRYQLPIPIDTKGARGQDVMTRTHATMSAATYGKRGLLTMMFNLATDDDDGNDAAGRVPPTRGREPPQRTPAKPPPVPESHYSVYVDEKTGEQREEVEPFEIAWLEADTARSWGEKLMACLRAYCRTLADFDGFIGVNQEGLATMRTTAVTTYSVLLSSIEELRKTYQAS